MAEQLSNKRGVRSSAQKEEHARNGYDEMPASSQVAGAHGDTRSSRTSDEDVALKLEEKRTKREEDEGRVQ